MYQFAFGNILAKKFNQPHFVDLDSYDAEKQHNGFELFSIFDLNAQVLTNDLRGEMLGWQRNRLAKKLVVKKAFRWIRKDVFFVDGQDAFENLSFNRRNLYLFGYWQSEKLLRDEQLRVRSLFEFKHRLDGEAMNTASMIAGSPSVSIHVRRGDYVTNKKASNHHAACPISYYINAINYIKTKIASPVFFVFSDDMQWARQNLPSGNKYIYVDFNTGDKSYRDMQLMSLCEHNIISNSTFSWWAGLLNNNFQKIIVAPKVWFRNANEGEYRIPLEWVRL